MRVEVWVRDDLCRVVGRDPSFRRVVTWEDDESPSLEVAAERALRDMQGDADLSLAQEEWIVQAGAVALFYALGHGMPRYLTETG